MKSLFLHSLLWRTLLPVIVVGTVTSLSLIALLVPPLAELIQKRADKIVTHTTYLATNICEERFSDILDLRMEENAAMNEYSQKEALEEIKSIAGKFPDTRIIILDSHGEIVETSFRHDGFQARQLLDLLDNQRRTDSGAVLIEFMGESILVNRAYFPFWRWHIIIFMPQDKYLVPVNIVKKIITFGVLGTLLTVLISLVFLFSFQVNRPLRKIIQATKQLGRGNFQPVGISGKGEIERVAVAFDGMVHTLKNDKEKIERILRELGESEEQYRILFEQAAVGVAISDSYKGSFVRVNRKYSEIVGYSLEELYQESFQNITHPEDVDDDLQLLNQMLRGEIDEYSLEKRFLHKDGSVVWGKITVSPMWLKGDAPEYHIAILEDITQRKLLEQELAEKNTLLESVIMQSPVPIVVIKAPDRKLLYINDAALEIVGIERSHLEIQLSDIESNVRFFNPDGSEYPLDETAIFLALQGVETINREVIIKGSDGTMRWVSGHANPVYNRNNEIIAAINIFPDITNQKRSEEAIRESEKRYRLFMEASPDPIVTYDIHGKALYINPAFTRIFGWTPEELLGRKIPYVPDNAWPETNEMLKMLRSGVNYSGFSTRRLDKSGKEIDVVFSWGVWRDHNDNPAGSIVIVRDVTKETMLKQQLMQAHKMESIGSLAGGIAHDFNNILSPIIGFSQILVHDLPPQSQNHEQAQTIFNAGMRARDLVKQILAFSRQSAHEFLPVKVQHILKEVLKLGRSSIPKSVTISEDIQSSCGPVMADSTQLHQVVMNLVTNAYHAVDNERGEITLRLTEIRLDIGDLVETALSPGNYALLSVADNGTGMPSDVLEKIFDPYFTTKKEGKGTGLGLSIVYGIVKDHKGDIRVYSEPGEGTTFNVYLPVIKNESSEYSEDQSYQLELGHEHEHILLVDDEYLVARQQKQMLERLGYKVSVYNDSLRALDAINQGPGDFDLVVTDMSMPNLTGIQLAERIRTKNKKIPIVMCTGFATESTKAKIEEIGINHLLLKPLLIERLSRAVRDALREAELK